MTQQVPTYLNEEFFQNALAETYGVEVNVKNMAIKYQKIDGAYCSDIYRVTIKYTTKCKSSNATQESEEKEDNLLVKELIESLTDNSREHLMYAEVLPGFHAIFREAGIASELSPKTYFTRRINREIHVFEDLDVKGYQILDRLVGFNERQMQAVLKKLGQFHAASMFYKDQHIDIVKSMKGFFIVSDENLTAFTLGRVAYNTEYAAKLVATWPGYKKIAEKMLNNVGENFQRKLFPTLCAEGGKVRVISHGDLWIRNILILEATEGSDAIFLDYQNSCETSAAIDVINVFMTSAHVDVLKYKRQELTAYYHKSLSETLKVLQYPAASIPSLQDILDEIRRIEYFSYYVLIFPFAQTNLSEKLAAGMDFNAFGDEKRLAENRADIYSNPRVIETYKHELKRLDALGVLD